MKEKENKHKKEKEAEMDCCSVKKEKGKGNGIWQGILYGLIPHVGCIAFIIFTILGVTAMTAFFKPLLMNRYFFYILIAVSLLFATISASIYLKRLGMLSSKGIKKKWKYLSVMYGTTILVNLLLFMVIFPYATNLIQNNEIKKTSGNTNIYSGAGTVSEISGTLSSVTLKVNIPCPGHAPLITGELNNIDGVENLKFSFPNVFEVSYDSERTSEREILSLDVFKEYKATIVDRSSDSTSSNTVNTVAAQTAIQDETLATTAQTATKGTCGCGGGSCSGGCGGSCSGSSGSSSGGSCTA